ncbi:MULTISPECIES: NirD/YgiW/YdeI family stress tolerance protein [Oscillatoriales]|uniref:Bacterial OB-fold domain-containing protein n=2 Tax=Limnospira TaxID=2596745 RepID=A0A9P1KC75_9CYAN|nr:MULTISPECIES: NirD/YgiW/YdeI family stress tolerance protein [Oscillatoriales]AMW28191.1 DNA-binding protein [Arthrospira platensis YZ]KDR56811.1 DNA-binding protein [Arthrospira platensis str. Paraca]MBD2668392.1 OB-fold nucleic acid binding domain-containing protein [Arthrospira platensis FACHB-439]MBD2711459.1 OB-fold nucleic acid binding domain-containing protein [Arthrospira platensis FACHB-835]MDF2209332.1 NirD/YgiW/YdeI family stress tolerance protein [Arthrospira platensis NCB002]M
MKATITALLTSALLTIGVPAANAQVSIQNLQRHSGVTISGTIRSVVGNDFILDDGTGQIIVDAGPMRHHQLNLQPGEQVTVTGKYDDYDFDAFTITRSNGEVIFIRDPQGPPPWSGGYRRRNSASQSSR